jgi:hypothetical protein
VSNFILLITRHIDQSYLNLTLHRSKFFAFRNNNGGGGGPKIDAPPIRSHRTRAERFFPICLKFRQLNHAQAAAVRFKRKSQRVRAKVLDRPRDLQEYVDRIDERIQNRTRDHFANIARIRDISCTIDRSRYSAWKEYRALYYPREHQGKEYELRAYTGFKLVQPRVQNRVRKELP